MLKRERIHRHQYPTLSAAKADVFDYIERFHNPRMRRRVAKRDQQFPPPTTPSVNPGYNPSKFSETEIVSILKQGDAGAAVKDLCRQAGISTATYYQWKSKYGGMEASDLRRVKELEAENAKLKRMYAELALDNVAMKDLIAKKL